MRSNPFGPNRTKTTVINHTISRDCTDGRAVHARRLYALGDGDWSVPNSKKRRLGGRNEDNNEETPDAGQALGVSPMTGFLSQPAISQTFDRKMADSKSWKGQWEEAMRIGKLIRETDVMEEFRHEMRLQIQAQEEMTKVGLGLGGNLDQDDSFGQKRRKFEQLDGPFESDTGVDIEGYHERPAYPKTMNWPPYIDAGAAFGSSSMGMPSVTVVYHDPKILNLGELHEVPLSGSVSKPEGARTLAPRLEPLPSPEKSPLLREYLDRRGVPMFRPAKDIRMECRRERLGPSGSRRLLSMSGNAPQPTLVSKLRSLTSYK